MLNINNVEKESHTKRNIFEGLGHFVVEFEQMVLNMKISLYTILGQKGLMEIGYARVLIADQTAYPILQKLRSLLAMYYKDRSDELTHINRLFEFTIEVIQHRNFILHGSWFLDHGIVDLQNAEVIKDKTFKQGIEAETRNLQLTDLASLTEKILQAKRLYDTLTLCIFEPDRNLIQKIPHHRLEKLKLG